MSESIVNGSIRNSMAGRNHKESATQSLSRQGGREFLFFSDFPCKRKSLNASALYIGKLPACFRYCTYGQKKRRNPAKNKRGGPPIFCSVILHNPQAQPQLLMKTTASVTQKRMVLPSLFRCAFQRVSIVLPSAFTMACTGISPACHIISNVSASNTANCV